MSVDDPETVAQWMQTVGSWSPEERATKEKALVKHIDRRLLPMLVSTSPKKVHDLIANNGHKIGMYVLNYIDRNALPYAHVQTLDADLGLKGNQYNIVLSITFIGNY